MPFMSAMDDPIDPVKKAQFIEAKRAMSVPGQIKFARIQRRWTQTELAAKAGISRQSICRFEKGTTAPTYDTLLRIARCMEMFPLVEFVPYHRLMSRSEAFLANLLQDRIEELRPEGLSGGQFGW